MLFSEQEFPFLFGWDAFFENQLSSLVTATTFPARVIGEERNLYRLQTGHQTFWATVRGKLLHAASVRTDFPAVGDWVLAVLPPHSERGVIQKVLERKSLLRRKQVGTTSGEQILAANVDYTFITTSVNADLNYRRIDRYLAVAREAGTAPVILLTKADLCPENLHERMSDLEREFPEVPVHAVSMDHFAEADFLPQYLRRGTTSVFLGSSGVGKSTLVNFLIGSEEIKTQEIRERDDRGRHTTTSRNLYVSRFGGLVIDTPGMRELQLLDQEEGVSAHFTEIEELGRRCRFSDCQHRTEPGCAILEALADGSLPEERWRSHQKLEAEARHGMRKVNKAEASRARKGWKRLHQEANNRAKFKKGEIW